MKGKAEAVIDLALELSEEDRSEVVDALLASLEPEDDPDADAAWASEIEKRMEDLAGGTVRPVSWEGVKEYAARRHRESG